MDPTDAMTSLPSFSGAGNSEDQWIDGALACWNQEAFKGYQCQAGTTCCGRGPVESPSQEWNKCCMGARNSGVQLELWSTLAICMVALIMAAGALILFAEIWRRRAQEKFHNMADEMAPDTAEKSGKEIVIDMEEIPKPLRGIIVRNAVSPAPSKKIAVTADSVGGESSPKMNWFMRKLSSSPSASKFSERTATSPTTASAPDGLAHSEGPVRSLRQQYSRSGSAAYPDSPGTVSSSSGSETCSEPLSSRHNSTASPRAGSSGSNSPVGASHTQRFGVLSRFKPEHKRTAMSELSLNQPANTVAPAVTCQGTVPATGKEN